MSDKDIQKSYERSAERMAGSKATLGSQMEPQHYNDPDTHPDLHEHIKVNYDRGNRDT